MASDSEGDWLDAVIVALDHLKSNTEGTNVRSKRIILFSDLVRTMLEKNHGYYTLYLISDHSDFQQTIRVYLHVSVNMLDRIKRTLY